MLQPKSCSRARAPEDETPGTLQLGNPADTKLTGTAVDKGEPCHALTYLPAHCLFWDPFSLVGTLVLPLPFFCLPPL